MPKSHPKSPEARISREVLHDFLLAAGSPDNQDAFLRRILNILSRQDALGAAAALAVALPRGENPASLTASLNFTKKELQRLSAINSVPYKWPENILWAPIQCGPLKGCLLARLSSPDSRGAAAELLETAAAVISGRLAQENREAQLIRERDIADSISHLEELYLAFPSISIEEISRTVLDEARRLTGSAFGFAGYIDTATGFLCVPSASGRAGRAARGNKRELLFKEFAGLWGWVLRNKKPLLTNSAGSDPRAKGLPGWHVRISRFAAAPAISGNKLLGIIALANPPGAYPPAALDTVKKLARIYALMLHHKLSEKQMQADDSKNKSLLDSSLDMIFNLTVKGELTYVSRAIKNYGYSPEEVLGKSLISFVHPADRERIIKIFLSALKKGSSLPQVSYRLRKKDGSFILIEQKTSVLPRAGSAPLITGVLRDITEYRQAQEKLAETEKKHRTLFENAQAAIIIADAATGTILDVNKNAEKLTGWTRRELIGMNRLKIHPGESSAFYLKQFKTHSRKGQAVSEEAEILRKDGSVIHTRLSSSKLKLGDREVMQGIFLDMTGQRRAELLVRNIVEMNPMSIQIVDKKGYTLTSNPAHTRLFGSVPPPDYSIFEDRQLKKQGFGPLLTRIKKGETVNFPDTSYNVHKFNPGLPDRPVWLRTVVFPLKDSAGKPERFVIMHEDITARKQAELAIRDGEENYKRLVENLGKKYFFYQHDTNGIFSYLSPSIKGCLGYTVEEFMAHFSKYLTESPLNKDVLKHTALCIRGIQQPPYEVEIYHKNGSTHLLEVTETPLRGLNGEVTGVEGLAHDITEQKLKEKEVKESETRYKALFAGIATGILVADSKTKTFLYANPAMCRMLGYTEKEFTGLGVHDIHPKKYLPHVLSEFEAQARGEKKIALDLPCLRKNGTVIWVNILTASLFLDGRDCQVGQFTDITESKRLANILSESEEKYRTLFETSRDALMILEPPRWKFAQANEATLNLFGAPEESDFLKLTPWDISPKKQPDGRISAKKAKKALGIALKTGSHSFEWEHKRLYGPVFSSEVLLTRVQIGGKPFIQSCVRDISARKRIEELLRQSELRQQLAMSQINGILWVLDRTLRFTLSRGQGLTALGLKPDQLVGMTLEEFMGRAGPGDQSLNAHYSALRGKNVNYEVRISNIDFSVILSPLRDKKNKIIGVVGLGLNITDKKRMERLLKENQETLSKIFETTTDGMYIKDLSGIYTIANSAFARLFNKKPKEIQGVSDRQLLSPEDAADAEKEDSEMLKSGKTLNFTRTRTLPAGTRYFNTIKTPIRNLQGKITGVLGISRDITSLKKMETELALTRAAEAVGKVARPIAHDFNNALAAINGYATLIDEDLAASSPIKTEISRIIEAGKRAAELTSKFQDFARNPKIDEENK